MAIPHRKLPKLIPQEIKRFWSKVNKTPGQGPKGDCWEWQGGKKGKTLYGRFWLNKIGNNVGAHRVAYFLATGIDPGELNILHACDNPPCCNPQHLSIGTYQDDADDRVRKGRTAKGDRSSVRLHPEMLKRGEEHHFAKLTDAAVREIRSVKRRTKEFSIRFGVSVALIKMVRRGKIWRHVL